MSQPHQISNTSGYNYVISVLTGVLFVLLIQPLAAAETNSVQIHGFGFWTYGRTNGPHYVFGSEEGDYDHTGAALNFSAEPHNNIQVFMQAELLFADDELETELDFAFASWNFKEGLTVKFGRVKQPFGIYTEIFDLHTVRPFMLLPQSMYGPVGLIADGYGGVGLSGQFSPGAWNVDYDFYGGDLDVQVAAPFTVGTAGEPIENGGARDVIRKYFLR